MDAELIKRAEDLARRCERTASVTCTNFLTPAQSYELRMWRPAADCRLVFHGGYEGAERVAAFFLPDYMEEEYFDPSEYIRALHVKAAFGDPGHRDYMGAVLGLGIGREWLGDIVAEAGQAWIFCLPSVENHLLLNLDKVGRYGVKTAPVPLSEVPGWEKKMREVTFSVKSPRLDAVVGGMFGLSRSSAAEAVKAGLVSLNYAENTKCDTSVRECDIISLKGKGKGRVLELGGLSRRDRQFIKCGIYI